MGMFSWLDCKDNTQNIKSNRYKEAYVLIPQEFGGGHITENYYEGYGDFGGSDIYELVAEWNKNSLPDGVIDADMARDFCTLSHAKMVKKYGKEYKREIGIELACEDDSNFALRYPIKITYDAGAVYEDCTPSPVDENQGR